jgi:hypothetical protein
MKTLDLIVDNQFICFDAPSLAVILTAAKLSAWKGYSVRDRREHGFIVLYSPKYQ